MWIRVPRTIFLVVGAIVGFFITAPLVAEYATAWWWLSVPALAAYVVVLWIWGLKFISSAEDVAKASILEKVGGVLILLGYSFVGVTLLVFIGIMAVKNWFAVAATFVLLALVFGGIWISVLMDEAKAKKAKHHAKAHGITGGPAKPDDIVT